MWEKHAEILNELKEVEKLIIQNIKSRNALLTNIVYEIINAGGKRLRPAFTILAAKFGNYDRDKVLRMAGAIEILHTATLIHDDIIDRSNIRRGKPTVSSQYGVDMAVYTGDYLFTKAITMLSKNIPVENLDLVAKACKAICEGEVEQYEERYNINTSVISYLKRISKKTAILFSAACATGAHLSEVEKETAKKLTKFGFYYGMAFQIKDDLNDFISSEVKEGKPVGNDIAGGNITLPIIYALRNDEARKSIFSLLAKEGEISIKDMVSFNRIIKESDGIISTEKMLMNYISRGKKVMEDVPDCKYKDIFLGLIDSLNE